MRARRSSDRSDRFRGSESSIIKYSMHDHNVLPSSEENHCCLLAERLNLPHFAGSKITGFNLAKVACADATILLYLFLIAVNGMKAYQITKHAHPNQIQTSVSEPSEMKWAELTTIDRWM